MTVNADKLVRMAQQIADNNSFTPDVDIVAAKVADHLQRFWDPRMKQQIIDYASHPEAQLSAVVREAIARIREPG
ncbi:MAG: formate dehydrogenase subunit delta [Gammaproteobacteria bacterium]|nr:formate dehydrogenase subunit delta [Gammaproteobacteria bacterium]